MELTNRQRKAVHSFLRKKGGACWWRVGTGKTRITFAWFALVAKLHYKSFPSVLPRFMVVCRREAFNDWHEEMVKLGLKWRVREVECDDDLYEIKTAKPLVYLISHGMLAKLKESLLDSGSMIQAIAFDEGFLYKNATTQHCKAAHRISKAVGQAVILSGSVITAKNLEDVFGQLYAINKHQIFARTLTDFRSKFMFEFAINPERLPNAIKQVAKAGSLKRISTQIGAVANLYFPDNSQRRIVSDVRRIPATDAQSTHFKSLKEFLEIQIEEKGLMYLKNTPSAIIKCQQISDGFVRWGEETIAVPSAKMKYLLGQIAELLSCGEKVVIWCAFQHSVTLILQALQKSMRSVRSYGMHGSLPFDAIGWKRNGQVAVATAASGSSVNHFRDCGYAIYYSHSFRWLDMQQSMGRTDRHDSPHQTCYYYYLQTIGSLDSFVYQTVFSSKRLEKNFIADAVLSWLKH